MSRVGQNPVNIPDGVEVSIVDGELTAKGKLGTQTFLDARRGGCSRRWPSHRKAGERR